MASSRKGGPEASPVAPAGTFGAGAGSSPDETAALIDPVFACLQRHLSAGGHLVAGYSGGLDSTVLLHLLADLRARGGFSLAAVHVHHGLSPHADDWARHCERVCGDLEVPMQVARVEVRRRGEGLEAAARAARYAVFADIDADAVALAHHRDDQAETVLAQLLRGGGAKGLAAMPECRRLAAAGPLLLRPLLQAPRARIAAWAHAHRLLWVEDESNLHTHLVRNLLRHQVLPLLETRFAASGATLARAADRFAETAALLDELADLDAGAALSREGLSIAALAALSPARARNLLRRRLELAGAELHADSLREGLRQLLQARRDAQVVVDFGAVSLRRHRGVACIVAATPARPVAALWPWRGEALLELGDAGGLRFTPAHGAGVRLEPGPVTVRLRRGGEHLRPDANRPRRSLKNLLREAGIPSWRRQRLPLVYVGERLAWAAEIGADSEFVAASGEPGWLISPWSPA